MPAGEVPSSNAGAGGFIPASNTTSATVEAVASTTTNPAVTATTARTATANTGPGDLERVLAVSGLLLLAIGYYFVFVVNRWQPIGFRLPWEDRDDNLR